MCKCDPNIKTIYCGRGNCKAPTVDDEVISLLDVKADAPDFIELIGERNQLLDDLWLGGYPVSPIEDEIKFSICLAGKHTYFRSGLQIISAHFEDVERIPDENFLHGLADLVNRCRKSGPTLVHCAAGLNRSGLITGLALMKTGWKFDEAVALMRNIRAKQVLYNKTFYEWLRSQG